MNLSKTILILACGLVLGAAISCKKDSDEDSKEYLTCELGFDLPAFMANGSSIDLVPRGGKTPVGGPVGYYWVVSTSSTARDTTRLENDPASVLGTYHLDIPEDFTGTITVTLNAFASEYYNTSKSTSVIVINEETSLSVPGFKEDDPMIEDPRDGKSYRYVTIGTKDWFASNLAYEGGFPCSGSELMRKLFGTFYLWDEARTACPEGWRLPSAEDWKDLAVAAGAKVENLHDTFKDIAGKLMVDATFNDSVLWAYYTNVQHTNTTGFSALPCGYANIDGGASNFADFGYYSVFWTAEEANEEQAYYRYLYESVNDINLGRGSKTAFACPVRCVRDSE